MKLYPLTILSTGLYGHELLNQNGAPIRLVVPWKCGFKSIKSIVAIRFAKNQPDATYHIQASMDFTQTLIQMWTIDDGHKQLKKNWNFMRRETLMFNGYEDEVSHLYRGMDLKKYY